VAQAIVTGKLSRSFQKHHSLFAKTIAAEGKLASLHTPAGVYLGEFLKALLDAERVTRIFSRIVRAIYFHARGKLIPQEYVSKPIFVHPLDKPKWDALRVAPFNGPHTIGQGVITYHFLTRSSADPFSTVWLFFFYESIHICVITEPHINAGE
jgi:hypothetical protein